MPVRLELAELPGCDRRRVLDPAWPDALAGHDRFERTKIGGNLLADRREPRLTDDLRVDVLCDSPSEPSTRAAGRMVISQVDGQIARHRQAPLSSFPPPCHPFAPPPVFCAVVLPCSVKRQARETQSARAAEVHLAIRPGTNLAVLNGLAQQLIENDMVDRVFVED